MKKTFLITLILLSFSSFSFSQVKFGIGGILGTKTGWEYSNYETSLNSNVGIHVRALFDLPIDFKIIGGISYFFPTKITKDGVDVKYNNTVFSADLSYTFYNINDINFYGLGGLNYTFIGMGAGGEVLAASGLGIEAGAGIQFKKFFFEGKYDINMKQVVGIFGIYF